MQRFSHLSFIFHMALFRLQNSMISKEIISLRYVITITFLEQRYQFHFQCLFSPHEHAWLFT